MYKRQSLPWAEGDLNSFLHIPNGESDVARRAAVIFAEWAKILGEHLVLVSVGASPSSVSCLWAVGG